MSVIVHKVKKPFTGAKRIIGLWDKENTQLPARCTYKSAVSSLYIGLNARGIQRPIILCAVGSEKLLDSRKAKREMDFFVDHFIPVGPYKEAADKRIEHMMIYWSKTHEEGDSLLLIANDGDHKDALPILKDKGQHLLLFGDDNHTSGKLRNHAYIYWKWQRLLKANETNQDYMRDIMGTMKGDKNED